MHWPSFGLGLLVAVLILGGAVAGSVAWLVPGIEVAVPIDVDGYVHLVGQELSAAVIEALPRALDDVRSEVPELVSREMSGMFDEAVLDIGGWRVRIPGETLRELDEGIQSIVRDCVVGLLDDIDPRAIAGLLQSESEIRLRESLGDMFEWNVSLVVADRWELPVRLRADARIDTVSVRSERWIDDDR